MLSIIIIIYDGMNCKYSRYRSQTDIGFFFYTIYRYPATVCDKSVMIIKEPPDVGKTTVNYMRPISAFIVA